MAAEQLSQLRNRFRATLDDRLAVGRRDAREIRGAVDADVAVPGSDEFEEPLRRLDLGGPLENPLEFGPLLVERVKWNRRFTGQECARSVYPIYR